MQEAERGGGEVEGGLQRCALAEPDTDTVTYCVVVKQFRLTAGTRHSDDESRPDDSVSGF